MPSKYTFKNDNGYESGYESDSGTRYKQVKELGKGNYSRARKFLSDDGLKSKAILNPRDVEDISFDEVHVKYNFFKSIYPNQVVELIEKADDYRLVVPLIPGLPYIQLEFNTQEKQTELFLAAVRALKDAHNKGYVIIDLKEDNILYDAKSGQSYLIDGGFSVLENESICQDTFIQETEEDILYQKETCYHIAPECWSLNAVSAHKTMDIYSLGIMMECLLSQNNPGCYLIYLAYLCQNEVAGDRPSLDSLEKSLESMQEINNTMKQIPKFSNKNDKKLAKAASKFVHMGLFAAQKPLDQVSTADELSNDDSNNGHFI